MGMHQEKIMVIFLLLNYSYKESKQTSKTKKL